ncbi:hybrid sensor histidine kinase/response regulator transcription factor [Bacteroides hominis]|uniref:hybrid sensor histidine kinase/response regulator transcription factor n=1 Tax=Bacteroides hominis TaxID=2763023 RepID=UPI003D6A4E5A
MKHLNLLLLILFACACPIVPVCAFFDKDVRLLTMQDGLADNTILSIYKDRDGFMWFGTNNGLSRYDGRTIKNFTPSYSYVHVTEIVELSDLYLGVIAGNALYCFDRTTESFIPIVYAADSSQMRIPHLLPVDDKSFWAFSGHKLSLYVCEEVKDEQGDVTLIKLRCKEEYTQLIDTSEEFYAMCYGSDHQTLCLITGEGSLILFHPGSPQQSQKIQLWKDEVWSVTSVLYDKGVIWVSTVGRGLLRYQVASGDIDRITYRENGGENQLSHTDVFQVIPLNNNRYLAVTWSGYTLLMPDQGHPERVTTEVYNNTASQLHRSLETRMISAYYDPDGVVWIGTNGGGVMYSDLRSQFYNQFHQERHNEICGILTDSKKNVWMATFHQGIMRSSQSFDPVRRMNFTTVGPPEIRERHTVLCATKDARGTLWFGNKDGTLTSYDDRTEQFRLHTLQDGTHINTLSVWALYVDAKQRLWVGTSSGVWMLKPESGYCKRIPVGKYIENCPQFFVRAIVGSKDGSIWLGTTLLGVCRMMVDDNEGISIKTGYEEKAHIAQKSVRSLLASLDGNVYIGYMDGFGILSPDMDAIREFYTTRNGLCSNFIGCLVEDSQGHIWLGSNSGVSRYSRHQHLFYNYYISGSNRSALFAGETLFFGNNKTLTYFNPNDVDVPLNSDKVFITGLEVDSRPVEIGEEINGQTLLSEGISYTHSVTLNNANRDFALIFNNLSYSEEQRKYNYRLLPYQEHWQVSDEGEKASYTNLPEGDYTFEVKSIYPDGSSGEMTSFHIRILPHWSRTLAFRLVVFLAFVGLVGYLFRLVRLRQKRLEQEMKMKHELLTLNLEREKERQIRMERENFFTSAAHELRTPLTLILSPLQELLQYIKASDPLYSKLYTMYKNGTSLHTLVDQLLYVQKIEAGMVKLRLSEADIVGLVKEVAESFCQMAGVKGFTFNVQLPDDPVYLWIDAEKITSSVSNLLSNAFKYTSPNGEVLLSLTRMEQDGKGFCRITVSDTGTGIPDELQKRIFDSFITGDNSPAFSTKVGIGLRIVKNTMDLHHGQVILDSEPGKGSTFVLLIPEGKSHFIGDLYEVVDYHKHEMEPQFQPLSVQKNTEEEAPATKKTLLIIEDNVDVRQYIRSLFVAKYTILEATDGEEGIQVATKEIPDLIISDVMMPVKDGFACCREIRERQETAHIPILMLTAKAEDADVLQGSRSGADDYMMKPFNPEVLKAKVENLILQRERLKRIYTKALMLKRESVEDGEADDEFIQKLIHVVEKNLSDENFNVKMLAEQLHMSQPTLYRKVKQRSELSVVDMIRSVRVSKAASLILENRYSIQEISEMVGFSDARTLRKHFTEQFGVPPSKYMESK